jgi:VWFA-related protein
MRFRLWWSLVPAVLLVCGPAQTRPLASAPGEEPAARLTIHKRVEEVQVVFTVNDSRGRPVTSLARDDVGVLEDDRPAPAITAFHRHSDLALRLILLIDTSESMARGFDAECNAAGVFLARVVRPEKDEVSVAGFAAREEPLAAPQLLLSAAREWKPGGQTALYDTLYRVAGEELRIHGPGDSMRRVMVLLSDGEDNFSRYSLADAIEQAQRAEIAVYALTVHSRRLEFPGDRILQRLADATGGRYFLLSKYDQAPGVFAAIEEELRSQYVVSFRPAARGAQGGYHSVKISVRSNPKLKVRAREGYYADTE